MPRCPGSSLGLSSVSLQSRLEMGGRDDSSSRVGEGISGKQEAPEKDGATARTSKFQDSRQKGVSKGYSLKGAQLQACCPVCSWFRSHETLDQVSSMEKSSNRSSFQLHNESRALPGQLEGWLS